MAVNPPKTPKTSPATTEDASIAAPVKRSWENGIFLAAPFVMSGGQLLKVLSKSRWEHYVYGLCLDNGAVFYVGKGSGSRALAHAKHAARGEDSEKSQYIRAIGARLRYTIFFQCSDDVFARGYEAYLIHGHHEVLTNIAPASLAAIDRMLEPIDPFQQAFADLAYVDEVLRRGDEQCRNSLKQIIAGCPEAIKSLSKEEAEWMNGVAA